MSAPTFSADSLNRRSCTVVRAKRVRIRRLAPGISCVERTGYTFRINHEGPEAVGSHPGAIARAFYAFNFWLLTVRQKPTVSLVDDEQSRPDLSGARGYAIPALRTAARMIPRAIALAVVALLALTGLTRFVHVDLNAFAGSVHFGIPRFLTPWRNEDESLGDRIGQNQAVTGTSVIGVQPAQYPSAIAMNDPAGTSLPQRNSNGSGESDIAAGGAYVPQYYHRGDGSYLPLPADGPLPAGMSTYAHASTQVPGAVALTVHEPFTEPEESPTDEVALMKAPAADTPSASDVQLLGAATEVKAEPESDPNATQKSARKVESRPEKVARQKGPVKLEVHSAGEPKVTSRPTQQAHLPNALSQSQMAVAPVVIPSTQTPARQTATPDLILLGQPSAQAGAQAPAPADDDEQDQDAIPLTVHQAARRQTEDQEPPSGPHHPSFKVVTHTDDSLVVSVDGRMKQIPIGQALPDGSKLLGVSHDGGGFTTNRGDYTAY